MNSVGQSGDKKSYRVILLLVVGLMAFSSAMKELNELREFTRDASNLVASWSNTVAPAPAPAVEQIPAPTLHTAVKEIPRVAVEVEVCDSSHAMNAAEPLEQFQLGGSVAQAEVKIKDVGKTVVDRAKRRDSHVAMLKTQRSADIEMLELRKQARREADLKVVILADDDGETEIALPAGFEFKLPKIKNQRHIVVTPQERDLLKNLHRSLNLRSAG